MSDRDLLRVSHLDTQLFPNPSEAANKSNAFHSTHSHTRMHPSYSHTLSDRMRDTARRAAWHTCEHIDAKSVIASFLAALAFERAKRMDVN